MACVRQVQVVKIRRTGNYYEILGLQKTATDEEIKRACEHCNSIRVHMLACLASTASHAEWLAC